MRNEVWHIVALRPALAALLLVTLLPAISCSSATCSVPGAPCTLPSELASWNRVSGFNNLTARLYDRPMLDAALLHMGDRYHFDALFAKLKAGRRIVATALGSSFVHDTAGCFQRDLRSLWELGVIPNPMLYPPVRGPTPARLPHVAC